MIVWHIKVCCRLLRPNLRQSMWICNGIVSIAYDHSTYDYCCMTFYEKRPWSPRRAMALIPCGNCIADDTNGTDCWHRRTGSGRSMTAGVSRRSNQNYNWMWWAYCSSDSSQQCHSVANSTADQLNGLCQSYHPQHTLHELRAWRFSKIHSTVDLYSTKSDLKASKNCTWVWTQQWSRDF